MFKFFERVRLFEPNEAIWVLPRRSGLLVLAASERNAGHRRRLKVVMRRPGSAPARRRRTISRQIAPV
ncbi:MAG: hypothetical protein HKN60_01120 [Rhizobiales bacterium]|nr:hypothetical protein [Hyphomicrobiales bacterium]